MTARRFRNDNVGDAIEYVRAARRKIEMAGYHLECLRTELSKQGQPPEDPPIPVQAHFEGILYAVIAASDQTAEGINRGFDLQLNRPDLQHALRSMPQSALRSSLSDWHGAPILADVRGIRKRATHHHYDKAPGPHKLEVQAPLEGKPYGGPRGLVEYGTAAVEHLAHLRPLLDELERALPVRAADG